MRYLQLDFIRGIAIILMVVFHISFDLNNFHFINIDIYNKEGLFWFHFRMIILTLFITSVGISLSLVHQNYINYQKVWKRFITLFGASTLITLATIITFPHSWIYFGVLHFITLSSILAIPFLRFKYLSLFLGTTIVILFNLHLINTNFIYQFTKPLLNLPTYTEDLVSFTPWFGVILIGIFIGKTKLFLFPIQKNKITKNIAFLGKHSLFIYLAHQPIFFGSIQGLYYLLNN